MTLPEEGSRKSLYRPRVARNLVKQRHLCDRFRGRGPFAGEGLERRNLPAMRPVPAAWLSFTSELFSVMVPWLTIPPPLDRNEMYSASARYARVLADEWLPALAEAAPFPARPVAIEVPRCVHPFRAGVRWAANHRLIAVSHRVTA